MNVFAEANRLQQMVNNWCPATFDHEPFESRLMRAFMNATAYLAENHRALHGIYPRFRSLEAMPDPMVGYDSDKKEIERIRDVQATSRVYQPLTVYEMRRLLDMCHGRLMTFHVMSRDMDKHGNIPPQVDLLKPVGAALGFPFKEIPFKQEKRK